MTTTTGIITIILTITGLKVIGGAMWDNMQSSRDWARMNTLAEKLGHDVGAELDEREYSRLRSRFEQGQIDRGARR